MASGLENIETIESPFRRFVTTIGVFPTAFTDAMTYYECLAYLVKYIEDTVIPAVNENAEALEELQQYYAQLKSYIDNYFANLDVQDEINNKLDQMAEDGTLQEIITTYIQANVTWTFDSVADMKNATNLVAGSYAQTLGYYNKNDGGGAIYYITDTADTNEIQETIGSTLYATLSNVKTEGYIDLRWLGADNSGVNDSADELEQALLYSNEHYLTPIKVVGKFLIGRTISLVGSVSIFGMHVPGTARFFIQQTGTDYTLGNISQFILANNITAIKLKGIGNQSTNITTSNIYIKNIDITEVNNSKTSTFLDVNAWGGPSRPNVINSVEGHGINTFLSSVETATFSTSIMNLDMGSCNFWNCGTILNFPAQDPTYDGLMTLYLHDSILEQSKNIILETLCVQCNISRNLFENLTNTSTLKIKDSSSLIFDGNYFELNAGNFVFDTYSNIQPQFTSLGYVEFSHTIAVNTSMKFIFKRLNVNFKSYLLHMAVFSDCILKIDELSKRERNNFKLSNLLLDTPNYTICGINPNYTTTDSKELTSDSFFAPANFDTEYKLRQGKKCFTITSGQTLSNTSISGSAGDYIAIYYWRTSNNGESLRLNIVDAGGSGGYVSIPVGNALYDGYWLILARLSQNLTNGRLYVNTAYNAPIDCTMIRVMNLGQSPSTTSLYDKLGLYI